MVLRKVEKSLERLIEGAFARAFKSGLRPVEIGRRLTREIDDSRSIGVRGKTVVANHFTIHLSPSDDEELADITDVLVRDLAEIAREHARDEDYAFMGPITIEFAVDPTMRTGAFAIDARLREGQGGTTAGTIVLPSGERYVLTDATVTIGRLDDCNLSLGDPNVSRNHAEIRSTSDGFLLVDLGSLNGSKVNGNKITEHLLQDNDELTFGSTSFRFEAS